MRTLKFTLKDHENRIRQTMGSGQPEAVSLVEKIKQVAKKGQVK